MSRRLLCVLATATMSVSMSLALAATPAGANGAAPPPNDDRAAAQLLVVPATITGTTVGSTTQNGEPSGCSNTGGSVWYRYASGSDRGVVVSLAANGNLDVEVDVYQARRSRLDLLNCDSTDAHGKAAVDFRAGLGTTYYIRVAELSGTDSNSFRLRAVQGPPVAEPPGRRLPAGGARGTLDRVLRIDAAYHVHLTAGRPYRFNLLVHDDYCIAVVIYPPGTKSFESTAPVRWQYCGGYGVFTPDLGTSGYYLVRLLADRGWRDPQPYVLKFGAARRDDIAPGIAITNPSRRSGRVNGSTLDVVDLYRFDVARRSALDLRLIGKTDRDLALDLRKDNGRRITCACGGGSEQRLSVRLARGRYYVAVRALGRGNAPYLLKTLSRTITHSTTTVNGLRRAHVSPGAAVSVEVSVRPSASGAVTLVIQHFDPFEGWLSYRQRSLKAVNGTATTRWLPPTVGRWRVMADYAGTRRFAGSTSDYATVVVAKPLAASV